MIVNCSCFIFSNYLFLYLTSNEKNYLSKNNLILDVTHYQCLSENFPAGLFVCIFINVGYSMYIVTTGQNNR